MILGGTDEVKEWTGTLEGTLLDDGIDYVAVNEMSPVFRQPERPAVNKLSEP